VTTEFSWRYVFVGEVVIVVVILLLRRRLRSAPPVEHPPRLDIIGAALSALGLGLAVFGILKSSEWGLIEPRGALTIGGKEITPFGFSAVPFFILGGCCCLAAFAIWEQRREREGRDTLLDRSLLRITQPSCRDSSARSAPSRSSRCSPCGSHGGSRGALRRRPHVDDLDTHGQCISAFSAMSAPPTAPTRTACTNARPRRAPERRAARNP
jgi:hypothetical protein